jgi:predicted dehydrogenase
MKIAILGLGFMGEKHKKVLSGFSEIEISALIDSKYKTQEQFYHSLEDFLEAKPLVDLVIISTPNFLHYENAITLLENGYNVLIDKPFCFTNQEFQHLNSICKTHHRKAFLVLQNRFSSVANLLQNTFHEKLGKYAVGNEGYEALASRLKDMLKDPEKQKLLVPHLKKLGFNPKSS